MPNIINEIKLDFKDVLLRPKRSTLMSRNDHGLFTTLHKYYGVEDWKRFAEENPKCLTNVAVSSGMSNTDFERLSDILHAVPSLLFICLDVANGYSQGFVEYVRKVRAAFPTHTIMAGNVVTGEMVEELILSGADIIKVGIGPGSVYAAHGLQGHIISDGGCTCGGDIAKAFGAGADFVMAGGMFAGHDQCEGELIEKDGKSYKLFYGMSSSTAMEKHSGGVADYRASEGKTVQVPYRGNVEATVLDVLGGLRSACTYTGAGKLKELPRRATFIRCTQQLNTMYS
ncbi:hypothetical protein FQR65_LT19104 [Abscondita terminalis]|nr:hypothetical protein FQR65_LT19104 [Abscondita terminalis]